MPSTRDQLQGSFSSIFGICLAFLVKQAREKVLVKSIILQFLLISQQQYETPFF